MKKILAFIMLLSLVLFVNITVFAENDIKSVAENMNVEENFGDKFNVKSFALMEADSGTVICAKNENTSYSPASVTKIMTLLLVAEALERGDFKISDDVTISEYASSMGGSQVYLKEGEKIKVEELIKCTVIASANDAAVALAELVCGNEELFVQKMNQRAKELGLKNTNFENVTGLDDDTVNHVTSAFDIALMSKELINYDIILKYSSLWQDTIRDGAFTLTNTNRLVRYYDGCNGLKTGSTDKAGYCISVSAKRGDMKLIAVIMGAESSNERNEIAKKILDYGFATYTNFKVDEEFIEEVPVTFGEKNSVLLYSAPFSILINRADASDIEKVYTVPECIQAPVVSSSELGKVEYFLKGKKIGESSIYAKEDVEKITFLKLYGRMICGVLKK